MRYGLFARLLFVSNADPDFARRIFEWVRESRIQQDNEQ
jgi:hypothetical protein